MIAKTYVQIHKHIKQAFGIPRTPSTPHHSPPIRPRIAFFLNRQPFYPLNLISSTATHHVRASYGPHPWAGASPGNGTPAGQLIQRWDGNLRCCQSWSCGASSAALDPSNGTLRPFGGSQTNPNSFSCMKTILNLTTKPKSNTNVEAKEHANKQGVAAATL